MLYYDEAASGHAEPTLWYLLMCMYVCMFGPPGRDSHYSVLVSDVQFR